MNTDGLPSVNYQEVFLILNGKVSHQETKVKMINQGMIYLCFTFLKYPHCNLVVAEALNLLGSLMTILKGREYLPKTKFEFLYDCLMNEDLSIRENAAYVMLMISSGSDGISFISRNNYLKYISK